MAEAKPKYVRLVKAEIDSVIRSFKQPLEQAARDTKQAALKAPGKKAYEAAYPQEVRDAFQVLKKHNLTQGTENLYVNSPNGGYASLELGDTYQVTSQHYDSRPTIAKALIEACEAPDKTYDKQIDIIDKAARSLRSAASACKTRFEFGQVWPELYDLMGAEWVTATIDGPPACLPVVVDLAAASTLVGTLKKAA